MEWPQAAEAVPAGPSMGQPNGAHRIVGFDRDGKLTA